MKKIFIYGDREKVKNYVNAAEMAGAEVICSFDPQDSRGCDGLILSGGEDINPKLYGQENVACMGIEDTRDEAEFELIKIFTEANKPILGICRGHQILAVYFGAPLIQNIDSYKRHAWTEEERYDKCHPVIAEEGTFLHELYGREFPVNTAHHQAVEYVPEGFRLSATSDDGIIDGMEWPERNIYSVQFHPERMSHKYRREDTVDGKYIFDFFMTKL